MKSVITLMLLVFCSTLHAAMTPEETTVRTVYAKVSYAVELNTLENLTRSPQKPPTTDRALFAKRMAEDELRFEISDMRVGNLSDIAQVPYEDLVTKPSGGIVLDVGSVTVNYGEGATQLKSETANAQWQAEGQTVIADWNIPMEKMLSIIEQENGGTIKYSRYAAYTVTVRYRGQSRTSKALWLFGTDLKGNAVASDIDTVVGINGGALQYFLKHPVYPTTLLETRTRDLPVVREWFTAHSVPDASCAGKRDACCDLNSLTCGVAAEDLRHSLSSPATLGR